MYGTRCSVVSVTGGIVMLWCCVVVLCCAVMWYRDIWNVLACYIKLCCVARAAVLWVSQVALWFLLWCCGIWFVFKGCIKPQTVACYVVWHALQCCLVSQVALWAALGRILRIVTATLFVPAHAYNALRYTNPLDHNSFQGGRCHCPRRPLRPRSQVWLF